MWSLRHRSPRNPPMCTGGQNPQAVPLKRLDQLPRQRTVRDCQVEVARNNRASGHICLESRRQCLEVSRFWLYRTTMPMTRIGPVTVSTSTATKLFGGSSRAPTLSTNVMGSFDTMATFRDLSGVFRWWPESKTVPIRRNRIQVRLGKHRNMGSDIFESLVHYIHAEVIQVERAASSRWQFGSFCFPRQNVSHKREFVR